MYAAAKRLNIPPMSAPSATPTPTAKPASATRSHLRREDVSASSAMAKKVAATTMGCATTPQQAVEKYKEFNAAARPPRTQASGAMPSFLKNHHAPKPSSNKPT